MKKENLIFIKHILEAIELIEVSTKNFNKSKFDADKDVRDATIRRLEIIGEAAKNLTGKFKNNYKNIEWKKISGMRDKLIHHYFGVDIERVWNVVKYDIPKLKKEINYILEEDK